MAKIFTIATSNLFAPVWGRTVRPLIIGFMFFALLVVSGPIAAIALTSGYFTNDTQIKTGMTVSLSQESTAERSLVERASISRPDKIIGVVVSLEDSLLTVTSEDSEVYVATTGEVNAYVLDINGDIKQGDSLTISPVRGILMKASETSASVTGIALEDFDSAEAETVEVDNEDGNQTAKLEQIKINIDPRVSRGASAEGQSYFERLGRVFTSKEVSEVQVLAAFVIFLVVLVVEGGLMYGAIASTITALGRNPYSKRLIYVAFLRSLALACVVLLIGLGSMYMVIWL